MKVLVANDYVQTLGVSVEMFKDQDDELNIRVHMKSRVEINSDKDIFHVGPKQQLVIQVEEEEVEEEEDETP